jgi:hypothetical protein
MALVVVAFVVVLGLTILRRIEPPSVLGVINAWLANVRSRADGG